MHHWVILGAAAALAALLAGCTDAPREAGEDTPPPETEEPGLLPTLPVPLPTSGSPSPTPPPVPTLTPPVP